MICNFINITTKKWTILAAASNDAKDLIGTIAGLHLEVLPSPSRPRKTGEGAIERKTTKKWIILASTSSRVRYETRTIAVASIQRCDSVVTVTETAEERLGRERQKGAILIKK